MKVRALVILMLLAIPLAGCVVGGGLNYHFPNKPSAPDEKKCNPADKSADCARPSDRARP
jgi:predicted small lipoprotein YifL